MIPSNKKSDQKKFLFLIDNMMGGGAEKAIKVLYEELLKNNKNILLLLLENQVQYDFKRPDDYQYLSEKISLLNFLIIFFKFISFLRKNNITHVYATNTKAHFLMLLTAPFIKVNRILNFQVDIKNHYNDRKILLYIYTKLFRFADSFSFISEGIYKNIKNYIPKKSFSFLPNAINLYEINNLAQEEIDDEYKHIFDKKVVINIGRLTEQKNQSLLLKSFANIDIDSNLIIMGNGELKESLVNEAENLQIDHKVFFLNFQQNPFKFLFRSDLFVLSSDWEGFGNVIVEAMQCKLPVVSINCPSGPSEIINPGKLKNSSKLVYGNYGALVPIGEQEYLSIAIKKFLVDTKLNLKYRKLSFDRAKDFDVRNVSKIFLRNIFNDGY